MDWCQTRSPPPHSPQHPTRLIPPTMCTNNDKWWITQIAMCNFKIHQQWNWHTYHKWLTFQEDWLLRIISPSAYYNCPLMKWSGGHCLIATSDINWMLIIEYHKLWPFMQMRRWFSFINARSGQAFPSALAVYLKWDATFCNEVISWSLLSPALKHPHGDRKSLSNVTAIFPPKSLSDLLQTLLTAWKFYNCFCSAAVIADENSSQLL